MTKEQFDVYMLNVATLQRMKEGIKTLQIVWETDIPKIDLKALLNCPPISGLPLSNLKIEWINTELVPHRVMENIFAQGDLVSFVNLFRLIESEIKIFPPLAHRTYNIVNGDRIWNKSGLPTIEICDGGHRSSLAKYLGHKEIPVLFVEYPVRCSFNNFLWILGCDGKNIEIQERNGNRMFNLPLSNCHPVLNEENYIFNIN
ncbi:MAG TPA: hypothetical protein VHO50_07095 [Bacteroidales bacterium]|nr:hypothetical protein [Bacteroidales bacterium]